MAELCLVHANCQGEALSRLLSSHPPFARCFTIKHYLNYTREAVPPADLSRAKLFLYQKLGAHFGDLASEVLLTYLSPSCQSIQLPNLFFKGYWPFWISAPERIDFADSVLEWLLDAQLPPNDIVRIYLSGAHPAFQRLAQTAEASLAREYTKEEGCALGCADLVAALWRTEPLFYTVNHPGTRLIIHVAGQLLQLLGLPPLTEASKAHFVHPDGDFFLPIHPLVGRALHLPFADHQTRYPVFGQMLTHREFVASYLACRLHKVKNLAAFLHGRAGSI
ncbi:MAG: hypothetical protein IKN64_02335 [Desulfovibrio sp.]|nr:hypothetical protein [Desulfovibrio sp.]